MQAWIKAPVKDVDLQVTVSEVRPDGLETFVQDGWLRATARKLNAKRSTELAPILSLTQKDERAAARQHVHAGHDPALLRGPRVPCGLADPRDDRGAQRCAADLGVLADGAQGHDDGDRRVGREHAVAARSAGRAQRVGADAATAVSGPAWRAVPAVCGVDEHTRLNAGPGARA